MAKIHEESENICLRCKRPRVACLSQSVAIRCSWFYCSNLHNGCCCQRRSTMLGNFRHWDLLTMYCILIGPSLKSTWCWLAAAGLVCLPGCSGCESQTPSSKPPTTSQTESVPASEQKSSEKQSDASGSAAKEGSATETQTASGDAAAANSDSTANKDGESTASPGTKKSTNSGTGGGSAQQNSGSGSADRDGGSNGAGAADSKTTLLGQSGKQGSPGGLSRRLRH